MPTSKLLTSKGLTGICALYAIENKYQLLCWIKPSLSSEFLNDILINKHALYRKSWHGDYNDTKLTRTKASQHITPESVASLRTKRKHDSEEYIRECVFCGKKELDYLDKLPYQKKRNSMLHSAGGLHTALNNSNVRHV